MESFLRKYGWALNGAFIAAAALLAALVVSHVISMELAPLTVPELGELKVDKKTSKARKPKLVKRVDKAKELADRCLMECEPEDENATPESTCPEEGCPEGQVCQEGACVGDTPALGGEQGKGGVMLASDLNITLTGVMVARPMQWSTALIQDPTTKQTYVVSVGDQLLGVAELVEVRRDRIIIERNGRKEFVRLVGAISGDPSAKRLGVAAPRPAPKLDPTASAVARKATDVKSIANEGVTELEPGVFKLKRGSIDEALKDKRALSQGATVVPNYNNGKKNGLKLIGVKSNSVYGTLGMKSGDVLRSVNGKSIKSQAHAAELFEQFREADQVSIEVERGGKKQQLQYKIK